MSQTPDFSMITKEMKFFPRIYVSQRHNVIKLITCQVGEYVIVVFHKFVIVERHFCILYYILSLERRKRQPKVQNKRSDTEPQFL